MRRLVLIAMALLVFVSTAHPYQRIVISGIPGFTLGGSSGFKDVRGLCYDVQRPEPPEAPWTDPRFATGINSRQLIFNGNNYMVSVNGGANKSLAEAIRSKEVLVWRHTDDNGYNLRFALGPNAKTVKFYENSQKLVVGDSSDSMMTLDGRLFGKSGSPLSQDYLWDKRTAADWNKNLSEPDVKKAVISTEAVRKELIRISLIQKVGNLEPSDGDPTSPVCAVARYQSGTYRLFTVSGCIKYSTNFQDIVVAAKDAGLNRIVLWESAGSPSEFPTESTSLASAVQQLYVNGFRGTIFETSRLAKACARQGDLSEFIEGAGGSLSKVSSETTEFGISVYSADGAALKSLLGYKPSPGATSILDQLDKLLETTQLRKNVIAAIENPVSTAKSLGLIGF